MSCALLMIVGFVLLMVSEGSRWLNWGFLLSALLILWGALQEVRRARRRGRRW